MSVLLPAWLQSGAYNAEIDRTVPTALVTPAGAVTSRGGVRRWGGTEFQVVETSPLTMQVIVRAGTAWVAGSYTVTQGVYTVVNDGDITLQVDAANPTQPRIDVIVLEVLDQAYSGSSNLARVRVVTGTPAAAPVVPTITGNFIPLAQLTVGSAVTSIAGTAITDLRPYSVAAGGLLPVANAIQRAALQNIATGTEVFEISTLRVWQKTSNDWAYLHGGTPPTFSMTTATGWYLWTTLSGGRDPYEELRLTRVDGIVHLQGLIGNTAAFSTASTACTLPEGFRPERVHRTVTWTGTNRGVRTDILPDGRIQLIPGTYTHPANDSWQIDIHMNIRNHTIG